MVSCYRGMPKFVGAFFDTLYQHPTMIMVTVVGITALAGAWWYKTRNKPE